MCYYNKLKIKMKRITVSDIKAIQGLGQNSELYIPQSGLRQIFFTQDLIIVLCQPQTLIIYTIIKAEIMFNIKNLGIDISKVIKIEKIGNTLAIASSIASQLCSVNLKSSKVQQHEGHIGNIKDLIEWQGAFVSSSQDMTIRLWEVQIEQKVEKGGKMLKFPLALKGGHKGPVNTLAVYHQFLLSGSDDCTVMVWHESQKWCSSLMDSSIIKIHPCPLSSQILILTSTSTINFMPIGGIAAKSPKIIKILVLEQAFSLPVLINEIDDSFSSILCEKSFNIIEVNLQKSMHEIGIPKIKCIQKSETKDQETKGSILAIKWKGRCMFYGSAYEGVRILKI